MQATLGRPGLAAWIAALGLLFAAHELAAQDRAKPAPKLLEINWADPELATFQSAPGATAAPLPPAADPTERLDELKIPVVAFADVPQLVKNIAGPNARPIKPRSLVTDPKQPVWYHMVDTYDGVTITVEADRRVNIEAAAGFQIGAAPAASSATATTPSVRSGISISDGADEGMEGLIVEYTLSKFPNIPYTVTFECATKAKAQCRDTAVIAKDKALLRVISTGIR